MTIPVYGTIIEHGAWERYQPATLPTGAPEGALYAQRDGTDWYRYANDSANFQANTLKMVVTDNIVSTATADQTRLFPGGGIVLELTDTSLDNPHDAWSMKVYDPVTKTFSDPPSQQLETPLEKRVAALEAKLGV